MFHLEDISFNDVHTFVFHKRTEHFGGVKSFLDHRNDFKTSIFDLNLLFKLISSKTGNCS